MTATTTPPPRTTPNSAPAAAADPDATARLGPIARLLCRVGAIDPSGRSRSELHRSLAGPALLLVMAGIATASGSLFAHDLLHLATPAAIAVGCFWGLTVFTLDRYIVLSLDTLRGRRRLVTGIIRLAMAALLGWVVAEPFVLRIFTTEVSAELVSYGQEQQQTGAKKIARNPRYGDGALRQAEHTVALTRDRSATSGADPEAVATDPEVKRLQQELASTEEARRAQQSKVECENDGSCGTGKVGAGPEWERKKAELEHLESEVGRLTGELAAARQSAASRSVLARTADAKAATTELEGAEQELAGLRQERRDAEGASRAAIAGQNGLGAQMDALERLREKRPSIKTEWMLVTGLLVVLDTSAVALKLMQRPSAQDEVREIQRQAEVAHHRAIAQHEADQLEVTLQEDAVLGGILRSAYRQHHEAQVRTFLESVQANAEAPTSIGNGPMGSRADEELQQRIAARLWRTPGPATNPAQ